MLWVLAAIALLALVAGVIQNASQRSTSGWTPVKAAYTPEQRAARSAKAKQESDCRIARRAARNAHERVQEMMRVDTLRRAGIQLTRKELRSLDHDFDDLMALRAALDRRVASVCR